MNAQHEFQRLRLQEKAVLAMKQQAEKFARQEREKELFKEMTQHYVSQGIPKILSISYAKYGWHHATPRQ
jgi:hypothetical protein